jgi:hypothetical protein
MTGNVIPVKFGHPHLCHAKAVSPKRKAKKIAPLESIAIAFAFAAGIIIGAIISQGMVGL